MYIRALHVLLIFAVLLFSCLSQPGGEKDNPGGTRSSQAQTDDNKRASGPSGPNGDAATQPQPVEHANTEKPPEQAKTPPDKDSQHFDSAAIAKDNTEKEQQLHTQTAKPEEAVSSDSSSSETSRPQGDPVPVDPQAPGGQATDKPGASSDPNSGTGSVADAKAKSDTQTEASSSGSPSALTDQDRPGTTDQSQGLSQQQTTTIHASPTPSSHSGTTQANKETVSVTSTHKDSAPGSPDSSQQAFNDEQPRISKDSPQPSGQPGPSIQSSQPESSQSRGGGGDGSGLQAEGLEDWKNPASLPEGVGGMAVDPNPVRPSISLSQYKLGQVEGDAAKTESVDGESSDKLGMETTGGDKFPTFDKWSEQYMLEQEKQKVETESVLAPNAGVLGHKKLRLNFAASTCGAKMVGSNPDADNVNHLLNGNPDEYMISPCKAKKWFVVELCELLQVHKVELGTLELFSSPPKSFRVFSSQRYPTKEWNSIGQFTMTPDRSIQSFNTEVVQEYVKFIKVEMLEHHGNEHYCPLTHFRVLGLDMATDDEDVPIEMEGQEKEEKEMVVSLFESAKKTVLKLVQKVLCQAEEETPEDASTSQTDTGETASQQEEASAPSPSSNATQATEEEKDKEQKTTETEAPCSTTGSENILEIPSMEMKASVADSTEKVQSETTEKPIITKLNETEQLPAEGSETPAVIKLEPESGDQRKRRVCQKSKRSSSWDKLDKMIFAGLLATTGVSKTVRSKTSQVSQDSSSTSKDAAPPDSALPKSCQHGEDSPSCQSQPASDPASSTVEDFSRQTEPESPQPKEEVSATNLFSSEKDLTVDKLQEASSAASQTTSFSSADVSATTDRVLEPSTLSTEAAGIAEAASSLTPGLAVQQSRVVSDHGSLGVSETLTVSPSPTFSSEDAAVRQNTVVPETEDSVTSAQANGKTVEPEDTTQGVKGQQEVNKTTNGSGVPPAQGGKPVDLVKIPLTPTYKRDNSVIKLNSRIVALEQNVSMTKRYLEELSHAFKQQNEDMMTLLNKTMNKLNLNTAAAEERDLRQQTQIDLLEQKVGKLTDLVAVLQSQLDEMGKELSNKQVILGMVQLLLFVWLLLMSVRGRSKQAVSISDHQFLLDTMPSQPQVSDSQEGAATQRRNSDVCTKSHILSDTPLKRQSSETSLASPGSASEAGESNSAGIFTQTQAAQAPKRKKKKKLKHMQEGFPVAKLEPDTSSFPSQVPSFTSSAGVLFGASFSHSGGDPSKTQQGKETQEVWGKNVEQNHLDLLRKNPTLSGPFHSKSENSSMGVSYNTHQNHNSDTLVAKGSHAISSNTSPRKSSTSLLSASPLRSSLPNMSEMSGFGQAKTDLTPEKEKTESQTDSPEFKLPSYHRQRLKKLGRAISSTVSNSIAKKSDSVRKPFSYSLKQTSDSRYQQANQDYFIEEDYLSENRFKFQSSPSKESTSYSSIDSDEGNAKQEMNSNNPTYLAPSTSPALVCTASHVFHPAPSPYISPAFILVDQSHLQSFMACKSNHVLALQPTQMPNTPVAPLPFVQNLPATMPVPTTPPPPPPPHVTVDSKQQHLPFSSATSRAGEAQLGSKNSSSVPPRAAEAKSSSAQPNSKTTHRPSNGLKKGQSSTRTHQRRESFPLGQKKCYSDGERETPDPSRTQVGTLPTQVGTLPIQVGTLPTQGRVNSQSHQPAGKLKKSESFSVPNKQTAWSKHSPGQQGWETDMVPAVVGMGKRGPRS